MFYKAQKLKVSCIKIKTEKTKKSLKLKSLKQGSELGSIL